MKESRAYLGERIEIRLYEDGSSLITEFGNERKRLHSVALDCEEAIATARAILKHFGEGLE